MAEDERIETLRREAEGAQYRSATANAALGLAAANFARPLVKPLYNAAKDMLAKDSGPSVEIPAGTVKPTKD